MTAPRKGKAETVRMKPIRAWRIVNIHNGTSRPTNGIGYDYKATAEAFCAEWERPARVLVTEVEK